MDFFVSLITLEKPFYEFFGDGFGGINTGILIKPGAIGAFCELRECSAG